MVMFEEILRILNGNGVKMVLFTDNLVILVSELFSFVMNGMRSKNPSKMELLFTTKARVFKFHLRRLNGERFLLSSFPM